MGFNSAFKGLIIQKNQMKYLEWKEHLKKIIKINLQQYLIRFIKYETPNFSAFPKQN